MKKIKIAVVGILLILLSACGSRVPFAPKTPLSDAALVYLYVSKNVGINEGSSDPYYRIRINNKLVTKSFYNKFKMNFTYTLV